MTRARCSLVALAIGLLCLAVGGAVADSEAAPGLYRVTLELGSVVVTGKIRIRDDPILE